MAHSEVQCQLRQMAQKGKDSEENEAALMQEAMSTAQKLYVLLEKAKATAKEEAAKNAAEPRIEEDPEFSHQNELESTTISPESWKTHAQPNEVISGSPWKMVPRIRSSAGSERPKLPAG